MLRPASVRSVAVQFAPARATSATFSPAPQSSCASRTQSSTTAEVNGTGQQRA